MVFGNTSAKITTSTVMTPVAYSTPTSPNHAVKMPVARAEAPILAMLLPSSSAPIMRSRSANRPETTPASRLPCFDSRSMLARDAPVSAVSLAEKNADTSRQARTTENVSQSMTKYSLHPEMELSLLSQFGGEEITHQRRLDIVGNHRAADCLEQDEGEPAALDLLVLRHQRQQRVGVRKPFLGKSRDVLQTGRQAHLGKMMPDSRRRRFRDHSELRGKFRGQRPADRNPFAMEQAVGKTGS